MLVMITSIKKNYLNLIKQNSENFIEKKVDTVFTGVPSQLLTNRPDIRQAEYELAAAKLDIKAARANFYPSLELNAGVGLEAFKTKFLTSTPESLLYSVVGDVVAPLINRAAIKAEYKNASARQVFFPSLSIRDMRSQFAHPIAGDGFAKFATIGFILPLEFR